MDRRSFVLAMLAAGSGLAAGLTAGDATAATPVPDSSLDDIVAALPDSAQADWSQHRGRHRHGPPPHHRRHHRRHRRRVCRTFRDGFGRRVTRCHWVWV